MAKFTEGSVVILTHTNNVSYKALIGKKAKIEQVVTFGLEFPMYWVKVGRKVFQVNEEWLQA